MTTIQDRALAALRRDRGPDARLEQTLEPITVSARRLNGEQPFIWHSYMVNIRNLETHNQLIALFKKNGRLTLTLNNVEGYAFYVECAVFLPHGAWHVRWDALMSPSGPVNGRAVRIDDRVWYFATPRAAHSGDVHITIDAQDGVPGGEDEHFTIYQIDVLGFR
jgi:hypothetical protein